MSKFLEAFEITIGHEGGHVNDPADRGGETYYGISRKNHGDWMGWELVDQLKDAELSEKSKLQYSLEAIVKAFYNELYWDAMKLDEISDQAIANEMFDTGVNQGSGTAAKYFQEAMNLTNYYEDSNDVVVDGAVGPKTLQAFNAHRRKGNILKTMNILQGMRYVEISRKDPSQEKFFNGWLNRVEV